MLVRNVGHLMTSPAILDDSDKEVFEGILDSVVTALIALHDLNDSANRTRELGHVCRKTKMHGPEEVPILLSSYLSGPRKTIKYGAGTMKVGIMDEERRNQRQSQGMYSRSCGPSHLYHHWIFRPHRR